MGSIKEGVDVLASETGDVFLTAETSWPIKVVSNYRMSRAKEGGGRTKIEPLLASLPLQVGVRHARVIRTANSRRVSEASREGSVAEASTLVVAAADV